MLERFKQFVKGQDEFGHQTKLNYQGEESFSTWTGAILSIAYLIFIAIITLFGVVEVMRYRDPQVTQVSQFG